MLQMRRINLFEGSTLGFDEAEEDNESEAATGCCKDQAVVEIDLSGDVGCAYSG
jgi:hypothetical protein